MSSHVAVIQPLTSATLHNPIFTKRQSALFSLHFVLLLVLHETELAKPLVEKQLKGMKKKRWQISEQMLSSGEIYLSQQATSRWINIRPSGTTLWEQLAWFAGRTSEKACKAANKNIDTAGRGLCYPLHILEGLWSMAAKKKKRRFFTKFGRLFVSLYIGTMHFNFVQSLHHPMSTFT